MTVITKGHSASQGGLRGHSIGDIYPLSILGVGCGDNFHWEVMNCINPDFERPKFWTSKLAYNWAKVYKEYAL